MADTQMPTEANAKPGDPATHGHVARFGLIIVFGLLVSCFGLLIAASRAAI